MVILIMRLGTVKREIYGVSTFFGIPATAIAPRFRKYMIRGDRNNAQQGRSYSCALKREMSLRRQI